MVLAGNSARLPDAQAHTPATYTFKAAVAFLLTFAAGYVDVVGYLELFHVFTANMTGNTVHLAREIMQGSISDVAVAAAVMGAFLAGSVIGRTIIEVGARYRMRRIASYTLLVEAGLIGMVAAVSAVHTATWQMRLLIMLAIAMGVQTATLTRVGPLTVHTTFVTGMLNKLAQVLSHGLFLTFDAVWSKKPVRQERQQAFRRTGYFFSIWLLYFVGAMMGARMELTMGLRSLVIPVVLLAGAVVVDQLHPLSVQEEQDQA